MRALLDATYEFGKYPIRLEEGGVKGKFWTSQTKVRKTETTKVETGLDAEAYAESLIANDIPKAISMKKPEILAMSALLTTTMTEMKNTIDALKSAGLRNEVKIIVGGAPVTPAFAAQIGADGNFYDAPGAAKLCKELLQ